jgi:uncharacterized protein (TIGR04255 family)
MVSMDDLNPPGREREIYPNAPLTLVAAEVRYPLSPRLAKVEPDLLLDRLGDRVPIVEEARPLMQVMVGPPGGDQSTQASIGGRLLRLISKHRDLAVTITGTNAIVETTDYERFEVFLETVALVFATLEELGPPVGVERLGLRYIDEIRISNEASPGEWDGYIDSSLLGATRTIEESLRDTGLSPLLWQGVVQLGNEEGRGLQVRYGAGLPTVVNPTGPLRFRGRVDDRPAFTIDLDSFWQPTELGDFSVPLLMKESEILHAPLSRIFERIITDQLRNEVMRARKES